MNMIIICKSWHRQKTASTQSENFCERRFRCYLRKSGIEPAYRSANCSNTSFIVFHTSVSETAKMKRRSTGKEKLMASNGNNSNEMLKGNSWKNCPLKGSRNYMMHWKNWKKCATCPSPGMIGSQWMKLSEAMKYLKKTA